MGRLAHYKEYKQGLPYLLQMSDCSQHLQATTTKTGLGKIHYFSGKGIGGEGKGANPC